MYMYKLVYNNKKNGYKNLVFVFVFLLSVLVELFDQQLQLNVWRLHG